MISTSSDGQVKLIQTRINMVETYFANISTVYGTYCRKLGRLRDAGDDLSNALQQYAGAETLNRSLRSGLSHFADCLTAIEDYRQTMV